MKTQILIALGAVAALAGAANAQFVADDNYGVQLRKAPDFGPLLRAPGPLAPRRNGGSVQMNKKDRIQLELFPGVDEFFPNFDKNQPAGTRLQMSKSNFVVEIVRQDSDQALRQVAKVLGVRIVIDPEIKFLPAKTRSLTFNVVKDDVFDDVSDYLIRGEAIEKWKSQAGTYFFAAKPVASSGGPTIYFQTPDGFYLILPDASNSLPGAPLKIQPYENPPHIDPDFTWPKNFGTIQPLPNWEKREFNGQPFYNMPLPVPKLPLPDEKFAKPYFLPLPQRGPVK